MSLDHITIDERRYSTDVKKDYRVAVWAELLRGIDPSKQICLILSGSHGYEVPVLRRMGVRDENIIMVDQSPAKVATAKRINKARKATTYGRKLGDASELIKRSDIEITCANLDFCGNVSGSLLKQVEHFCDCLSSTSRVCVTYLRAREHESTQFIIEKFGGSREEALRQAIEQYGRHAATMLTSCSYKNNASPMAWLIWEVAKNAGRGRQSDWDLSIVKNDAYKAVALAWLDQLDNDIASAVEGFYLINEEDDVSSRLRDRAADAADEWDSLLIELRLITAELTNVPADAFRVKWLNDDLACVLKNLWSYCPLWDAVSKAHERGLIDEDLNARVACAFCCLDDFDYAGADEVLDTSTPEKLRNSYMITDDVAKGIAKALGK